MPMRIPSGYTNGVSWPDPYGLQVSTDLYKEINILQLAVYPDGPLPQYGRINLEKS